MASPQKRKRLFPILELANLLESIDEAAKEWKEPSLLGLRTTLSDQMTVLQRAIKTGDSDASWDAFNAFDATSESIIGLIRKELRKPKMPKYKQYQLQELSKTIERVVGLVNPDFYIPLHNKKQKVDPYTNPFVLLHAAEDEKRSERDVVKELINLQLVVSQTFKQLKTANKEKDYNQVKLLNSAFIVYLDKVQSLFNEFEGTYPEIRKIIVNFSHHKAKVASIVAQSAEIAS